MASSDADRKPLDDIKSIGAEGTRLGVTTRPSSMPAGEKISLRDHADYVSVTMEFRCNLKCVHCMIEGTMDRLEATPDAMFQRVLDEQRQAGRWKGLVLTGSEITLRRDLPELAAQARAAGFERVRIQTHGVHLARRDYARRLLDAGVNEYFVSVAGAGPESHDEITQVPGAWDKMLAGMEFLDGHEGVRLLTNTVVTALSFRQLPDIVERLAHLKRLVQMEFWNYWPMSQHDDKQLCAAHLDILPYLDIAIRRAREFGRFVEVKNFPECLLGDLGDALVNAQPTLIIDPKFWKEFDRNGFYQCKHKEICGSTECLGLNSGYVERFGWEADLLAPLSKK